VVGEEVAIAKRACQVCAQTLGGFLSSMGAERVPIQESGCENIGELMVRNGEQVDEVAEGR
jgi:hypothetical protein